MSVRSNVTPVVTYVLCLLEELKLDSVIELIRHKYVNANFADVLKILFFFKVSFYLKSDLTRWSFGPNEQDRINNDLPRLLYLFQTLPTEIPKQQFVEWDKIVSRYLWLGKNPVQYTTITKGQGQSIFTMSEGLLLFCPATAMSLCDSLFKSRWKDAEE